MTLRKLAIVLVALCLVGPGTTQAQLPTTPTPAPPTLWSFLGIPQAMQRARDSMSNRRGNNPQREREPPLKALADPANLESDVPAIKAAAEIKQAEDLKPQKIKAVKYLTTIGCGCYDQDGKVTEALVAAMGDCTEDVRLETVKAVADAAKGERCSNCKQKSCCNQKIQQQLAELAYEVDDHGCPLEPSERIREAAADALEICCPGNGLPPEIEDETGPGTIEGTEGPGAIETPNVPTPADPENPPRNPSPDDMPPDMPDDAPAELQASTSLRLASRSVPQTLDKATVQAALHQTAQPADAAASGARRTDAPRAEIVVDEKLQQVQIRLPEHSKVEPGVRLHVYRPQADGYRRIGEMEVLGVIGDTATARPVDRLNLREIIAGGIVVIP
ncbi:MAG: hypothetical protein MUF25_11535 [Pirellulaceae bacterium]|nr:hypothetical protein [Pirellulaceae bacterium]